MVKKKEVSSSLKKSINKKVSKKSKNVSSKTKKNVYVSEVNVPLDTSNNPNPSINITITPNNIGASVVNQQESNFVKDLNQKSQDNKNNSVNFSLSSNNSGKELNDNSNNQQFNDNNNSNNLMLKVNKKLLNYKYNPYRYTSIKNNYHKLNEKIHSINEVKNELDEIHNKYICTLKQEVDEIHSNFINPEVHHFSKSDIIHAFFGALIIGLTFIFKGLLIDVGMNLPWFNIFIIIIETLVLLSITIYFIGYRKVKDKKSRPFPQFLAKRIVTMYSISLLISILLLASFGFLNLAGSFENFVKLIFLIAMPCAIGAIVPSMFK
jgi:uncharacterized membrane protein